VAVAVGTGLYNVVCLADGSLGSRQVSAGGIALYLGSCVHASRRPAARVPAALHCSLQDHGELSPADRQAVDSCLEVLAACLDAMQVRPVTVQLSRSLTGCMAPPASLPLLQ